MAKGPNKPSPRPKGPTTGSGGMTPVGLPYGPQAGPREPARSGRPPDDTAERARARAEAQRALRPAPVRLRDTVAEAVFRILTNYDEYFRDAQTRAQIANSISQQIANTLKAITDTASRRTSITRTIETTINWTMSAVAISDIPTIKGEILAAIESVVRI